MVPQWWLKRIDEVIADYGRRIPEEHPYMLYLKRLKACVLDAFQEGVQ